MFHAAGRAFLQAHNAWNDWHEPARARLLPGEIIRHEKRRLKIAAKQVGRVPPAPPANANANGREKKQQVSDEHDQESQSRPAHGFALHTSRI
jgi:hypothetical protein